MAVFLPIDDFYRLGFEYQLMLHHSAAYVWERGFTRKQTLRNMEKPTVAPVYHDLNTGRMWLCWNGVRYWLPDVPSVRKAD